VITWNESDLEGKYKNEECLDSWGFMAATTKLTRRVWFLGRAATASKSQRFEHMKTRWFERVESASPVRLNSPYLMASFHDLTSLFFY